MTYEERRSAFENAAKKKGYCFEQDEFGRYVDVYLQEAWEIFNLVDLDCLPNNGVKHVTEN